ncbi:MAG: hypothetical protein ABJZ55_19700 [Fuerstiella sp.]
MAKDRTNSEPDDPIPKHGEDDQAGKSAAEPDPKAARAARLAAIKAAVDAGEYDSDEMLEIALNKMIQRLPSDRDD